MKLRKKLTFTSIWFAHFRSLLKVLFIQPMANKWIVKETSLQTIIIFAVLFRDGSGADTSPVTNGPSNAR